LLRSRWTASGAAQANPSGFASERPMEITIYDKNEANKTIYDFL